MCSHWMKKKTFFFKKNDDIWIETNVINNCNLVDAGKTLNTETFPHERLRSFYIFLAKMLLVIPLFSVVNYDFIKMNVIFFWFVNTIAFDIKPGRMSSVESKVLIQKHMQWSVKRIVYCIDAVSARWH